MIDPRTKDQENDLRDSLELQSQIDDIFATLEDSFDLAERLAKTISEYQGDDPNLIREVFENYWMNVDVTQNCDIRDFADFEDFLPYTEIYAMRYPGVPTTHEAAIKKARADIEERIAAKILGRY